MDQLQAIRVFHRTVEGGSFAEAARWLGLSPAAISKNIRELEAHLGVRLLNRTTRRMSLTEAGQRYHEQITRVLDDLSDADNSLGPLQQMPSGLLRVSAPMAFTLTRLSEAIIGFLDRHPDLTLDLKLEDRRVDLVKEGIDVAIRGSDRLEDSSLVARKLTTLKHVICASPDYFARYGQPKNPEDLRAHNCVQFTLSGHVQQWAFTQIGQSVSVPIEGRYKVTTSLAVRDALLAGFGLSLIPYIYVERDIAEGRLVTALGDWSAVETSIHVVYPSRQYILPKVRAFVDFLADELQAEG
ncbi:LysR family transcriptional regulator [Paracoccus saliphilus]|uniref:LysR family transcriptional regulator n=1 Tax=Paracoccus saliphilus TaxID=405559 RepID=A0AA46A7T2_9RHOB|nr:LysR family transcriptional regulator [Paracoccus saliphilus]WCR02675.1 LysR family transcriptional regulator [Paracoccus saliphilus]SIT17365.1 transcriptional regulator, LysR family [Paracoccus saliphilus]